MEQKMNNHPMVESPKKRPFHEEYDDDNIDGSFFSSSSDSDLSNDNSSLELSESDSFEDVTSPTSSSSLNDMSSLFQQLPIKRGLSKFYQGKSQSFTSLKNVQSLEDLVKPESPYNKKLKSCKSYGGFYENQDSMCIFKSTSAISKGVYSAKSRGSCSSLNARRGSGGNFMGSKPPVHPHGSSASNNNISNQTALFA
ncbi:protein OXIDATIVE STRESS 3-like [Vicia villosa]|uniref:protein OXIDATIVE STRESS 3-like n=1 Tax=Vicia villosa TaxID=3911 RepID=UPI00273CDBEE|nr:protein OXIDATIVE STRESS 3-like [Vicia villosa]